MWKIYLTGISSNISFSFSNKVCCLCLISTSDHTILFLPAAIQLLSVKFFIPNLTQVVFCFDEKFKHRFVSLSLGHMLDHFYLEEIINLSLITNFPSKATVSCHIDSRRLDPAFGRNLRRSQTSIIEKLLTVCELLGRWRGNCLSSSAIIWRYGWSRACDPRAPCDPLWPALHPQHQQ